nr:hypothetical protein Iba_scaffold33307CG0030 [Ipomoea batatas]GMD49374.1 hypothetical protein Iba_scaffold46756CG0150 [Ipomoea batatas]GME14968.1 hypothetical protein Iba_scaffold15667CG0040 [Ipomoea batatas]
MQNKATSTEITQVEAKKDELKHESIERERRGTVFERSDALVGDFKLERGQKRRRIVQHRNVREVHCAHCIEATTGEKALCVVGVLSLRFLEERLGIQKTSWNPSKCYGGLLRNGQQEKNI